MKQKNFLKLLELVLAPGLLILLGLVLMFSPDTATAFIAKAIAWVLLLVGAVQGLAWLFGSERRMGQLIRAAAFLLAGLWLLANPLVLAQWLGRILGIFILLQGLQDLLEARRAGPVPILTIVVGSILLLAPLTLSRTLLLVLGIVVLVVGVTELLNRLGQCRKLDQGDGPDIIDVEKL